eukprot:jgi/Ulvmu1/6153/UM028_0009.1
MQCNAMKVNSSKTGVTPGSRGFLRPVRPAVTRPQACGSPRHRRMRKMQPSPFDACFGMGVGVSPFIEGQLMDALKEFEKATSARYIPVDLIEEGDQFVVQADIPGIPKEDIKIDIDGDVLTLSVKQKQEKQDSDDKEDSPGATEKTYMRMERSSQFAPRAIRVPDTANPEEIQASHSNGVIVITIPKKEEVIAKKRSISIE